MIRKMSEESYIRLYTIIYSQKMNKKNDWRIVYSHIYNDFESKIEWKINKTIEWRIVYNLIYYHLQSKIDKKNE